ncbi:sigma-70 family RNA polymerase sigma factor [Microlunatus soli]|uniref:sigma-70 family RNA polymerase sigma factor n=1 Tax=Microlunatus soli TaxID=630515 RepID=UPI0018D3ECCA|nr:sigma-70 family RNA polymerase sigma factor [Microlunatus soli]
MVKINLPIADSLARRYRSRGENLEDLIQVARLGLVNAVLRYDPANGAFLSFAVPTISGEIKRHFRDHCWTVRPPRRLQELHSEVASAMVDLAQDKGSTPTAAEVADWIGADRADVLEAIRSNAFHSASLDTSDGLAAASGTLGATDAGFDEVDDSMERSDLMRRVDDACTRLSNDERRLLRLRFAQGRTQSSIADELNISQMSVSRRLQKITRRLRADVAGRAGTSPVARSMQRRVNVVPQQPARA